MSKKVKASKERMETDEIYRRRYFACLGMLVQELTALDNEAVNYLLKKYEVTNMYGSEDRVKVGLTLPRFLKRQEVVEAFEKDFSGR